MEINIKNIFGLPDYSSIIDKLQHSKVVIIRHGATLQNQRVEHLTNAQRPTTFGEWLDLQTDPSLMDSELSEEGIEQCKVASIHAKSIPFHTVFVSPMKRCLQTAYYILKNHPNFSNINFIIHPLLREKLHVTTDIPSLSLDEIVKEFSEMFNNKLQVFKKETYSNGRDWFLESIDDTTKNEVLEIMKKESLDPQQAVIRLIEQIYQDSVESVQRTYCRGEQIKEDIETYLKQNEIDNGQKIGIVGHSTFLRIYLGKQEFWDKHPNKDALPDIYNSVNLLNCEFYPDEHFKL